MPLPKTAKLYHQVTSRTGAQLQNEDSLGQRLEFSEAPRVDEGTNLIVIVEVFNLDNFLDEHLIDVGSGLGRLLLLSAGDLQNHIVQVPTLLIPLGRYNRHSVDLHATWDDITRDLGAIVLFLFREFGFQMFTLVVDDFTIDDHPVEFQLSLNAIYYAALALEGKTEHLVVTGTRSVVRQLPFEAREESLMTPAMSPYLLGGDLPSYSDLLELCVRSDRQHLLKQALNETLADAGLLYRGQCAETSCQRTVWPVPSLPEGRKRGRPPNFLKWCPMCLPYQQEKARLQKRISSAKSEKRRRERLVKPEDRHQYYPLRREKKNQKCEDQMP